MTAALALQAAVVAALKGSTPLAALVGVRIYDRVPDETEPPLVALGEMQSRAAAFDGLDAVDVDVAFHVWARDTASRAARPLAHDVADAVRAALHFAPLDLGPDWALVDLVTTGTTLDLDDDGLTAHAVVGFRASLDPAT